MMVVEWFGFIRKVVNMNYYFVLKRMKKNELKTALSYNKKKMSIIRLKIFIADRELHDKYVTIVEKHNQKMASTAPFADSGFDLYVPENVMIGGGDTKWVDHQIQCAMTFHDKPCGFYLYPRSSLSKTPLMLANHVGIVDAGYRGNLIGAFRNILKENFNSIYCIEKDSRLLQICHPSLLPIQVFLVNSVEELGDPTARGCGGFGST